MKYFKFKTLGHIISRLLMLVFCMCLLPSQTTWSIPNNQRIIYESGVRYFDVNAGLQCSSINTELLGNDNAERIFNFFIAKGLTTPEAAGITGNAIIESFGGDPTAVSPSGYRGIFQWDQNNRWPRLVAWTESQGLDPLSLEGQLEFSWFEANERGNIEGLRQFSENTDLIEEFETTATGMSAWYWGRFYEVAIIGGSTSQTPMSNVQHLQARVDAAQEAGESYGSSVLVNNSSSGADCSALAGTPQFIDNFTVYSQYDPAWKDLPYSSSTIGVSGCGPAAMAMIITALTGEQVTPVETAAVAAENNLYVPGAGSSWSIGAVLAQEWGLQHEPVERNVTAIATAISQGKLVIAPGAGPKPFTSGGHFIVIRGVTANGEFLVGDSGHSDTSDKGWDAQTLVNNMRNGGIYAIYK